MRSLWSRLMSTVGFCSPAMAGSRAAEHGACDPCRPSRLADTHAPPPVRASSLPVRPHGCRATTEGQVRGCFPFEPRRRLPTRAPKQPRALAQSVAAGAGAAQRSGTLPLASALARRAAAAEAGATSASARPLPPCPAAAELSLAPARPVPALLPVPLPTHRACAAPRRTAPPDGALGSVPHHGRAGRGPRQTL